LTWYPTRLPSGKDDISEEDTKHLIEQLGSPAKFVMRAIDSETDNRSQTANFDVMVEVVKAAAQIARSLNPEFFLDSVAKK